ncbi:hypothetical protein NDU88_004537 [Pleurodeles waltl]|uniref:Uncharacterized protein n=1 Tax=Pleurodeles waltl TaxID=8319 RepID=A0AAV7WYK4_PLEWA|nr:hypothetical protein NDU88_004537 [Pleurodeles waltl]
MLVGAGRLRVALPPNGQSMFNLNCPDGESPVVGIRGSPGSSHSHADYVFPGGCAHSCFPTGQPRGAPVPTPLQRRQSRSRRASGPAPRERGQPVTGKYFPRLFQLIIFRPGGFSSASSSGCSAWPYPGPQPQSGSKITGPSQCQVARVHRRPTPGPRLRSSGPVCSCRSPPPPQNGKPPGPARLGPDHQQGRGPSPAPGSPSPPGVCTRAETAPQRPRPPALVVLYVSRCRTAQSGASRIRISVGPSGAEQLSVRHVQLRGHAPGITDC